MIDTDTKASRNLSVLSYAPGFTAWHYRAHEQCPTGHYLAEVLEPDFFSEFAGERGIRTGDTIMCSCRDGGVLLFVTEAEPGSCKVAAMALAQSPSQPQNEPLSKPNQEVPMSVPTAPITYQLGRKLISVQPDALFHVQIGKSRKAPYYTLVAIRGDLTHAVTIYNCIDISGGYKKRLLYVQSRNRVLAQAFFKTKT